MREPPEPSDLPIIRAPLPLRLGLRQIDGLAQADADAISNAAQAQGPLGEKDPEAKALRAPVPPGAVPEDAATDAVLAKARSAREASGWELIYSRQRVLR